MACFEDQATWDRLCAAAVTPSPGDGFLAGARIIDDPAYADLSPAQLVALVPESAPANIDWSEFAGSGRNLPGGF